MVSPSRGAAIVGIHEHVTRYAPDKSEMQIHAECAIAALEDAGLSKNDIDGLFTASLGRMSGLALADYLDMYPKVADNTNVGGASFEFHLAHALSAIATGRINCALITYGSVARSGGDAVGTGGSSRPGRVPRLDPIPDSFEEVYGFTTVGLYAMIAQRHMHLFGTTSEQLAEVSVAMRSHAAMNPYALFRDLITVQDVVNSRIVSSPLHLLDCCIITDGGGAVIVASPELARNCRQHPVWILGVGEALAHQGAGKRDLIEIAAKQSHPPAFAMAGVTHSDIDMAMIYDSFSITVVETLENLGFCKGGEGGDFVGGGRIKLGGELPINTDGGGLSSNHPGMRGIFLLLEGTRQLRHEFDGTPRQVPDCNIVLCHGTGGTLGSRHSGGTVILGRD